MARSTEHQLLLGEWACLGILYPSPSHGFAIAARLRSSGDVGRVWSLSRPLTYRSLEQLTASGLIHSVGEERGVAGGNRTILAATRSGRAQLRRWVATPVAHLRDLRSELLLKLVIAELCDLDVSAMIERQRAQVAELVSSLTAVPPSGAASTSPVMTGDVVALWREESSRAALRFLERLAARPRFAEDPPPHATRPRPRPGPGVAPIAFLSSTSASVADVHAKKGRVARSEPPGGRGLRGGLGS
jgi:DNA-binding PadR family transcriptional regulator